MPALSSTSGIKVCFGLSGANRVIKEGSEYIFFLFSTFMYNTKKHLYLGSP